MASRMPVFADLAPDRGSLMAERPWKEVLKRIPEPLDRHRFGT